MPAPSLSKARLEALKKSRLTRLHKKDEWRDTYGTKPIDKPAPYCLTKPYQASIRPDSQTIEMVRQLREEQAKNE